MIKKKSGVFFYFLFKVRIFNFGWLANLNEFKKFELIFPRRSKI